MKIQQNNISFCSKKSNFSKHNNLNLKLSSGEKRFLNKKPTQQINFKFIPIENPLGSIFGELGLKLVQITKRIK